MIPNEIAEIATVTTTEEKINECHRMLTELMQWKQEVDEMLTDFISQFSGGGLMSLMGGLFGKR